MSELESSHCSQAKVELLKSEQESNCCCQRQNLTSNLNHLGAVGLGDLNE